MFGILGESLWFLRFAAGAAVFIVLHAIAGRLSAGRCLAAGCAGGAAFIFCGAFYGFGEYGLISLRGILAFAYLGVLTVIARIDWNTRRIYDGFHIYILLLGIAAAWVFPERAVEERLAGILAAALPMLVISVFMKGAFGGGDIKLMAASGFLLGWRAMVPAVCLGILTGGTYCAWMLAGKKMRRKDSFALGPFLAIGLAAAFFYGDAIWNWYLAA